VGAGTQVLVAGCQIPDFGPDAQFSRLKDLLDSQARHREMLTLVDSMRAHYEIPSTFDGAEAGAPPRMQFGETYLIPDRDGKEISARLYQAQVLEAKKSMMGVYETFDGRHVMVTTPLTEAEVAAWKAHPDTFFGELQQLPKHAENWLELAQFFYDTYKSTGREKLLEWMKDARDIEYLRGLPQDELAILYCERLGWGAASK
jgi:hypothetical protein